MGRDDRRSGDRIPVNEELSAAGSTWVSDLSLGGVFVHTEQPLPVGASLDLRFTLLLDDPVVVQARATVARLSREPRGMGVRFTSLEPLMRARIEAVLERQRPIDSGAPLRLPEPTRELEIVVDDTTTAFARPAPVESLSFVSRESVEEDAPTAAFVREALPEQAGQGAPGTDERDD